MSRIKGKGNRTTEIALIELFKKHKITGWRRNQKILGKPDFVFPKQKIIIFADGCFWHGHNCRNTISKTNKAFWERKISDNKHRDRKQTSRLRRMGWSVYRIWECQIRKGKIPKNLLNSIKANSLQ
ncbi:very short patch repair endonuclease [Leptospira idonii]|uniref:Very short patch repair endonuclease n=2 Tax=Leptospira idonii TaxID=1193500 RepID=A0A4R9M014_9LEPT|nr:very short patch repair endonuclease [Leptospira idonii]